MIIKLRDKKTKKYSRDYIKSCSMDKQCHIFLSYNKNKKVFEAVKKTLSRFYLLEEDDRKGKSKRGSVGKNIRTYKRLKNDPTYAEKRRLERKNYYEKNTLKSKESVSRCRRERNKLEDRHCLTCNKLLNYSTKGNYCFKHFNRYSLGLSPSLIKSPVGGAGTLKK